MDADQELDARQLRCPLPLLRTRQALNRLHRGALLRVKATDPGSRQDIPGYLGQSGHELVQSEEHAGEFHFLIRVGEP